LRVKASNSVQGLVTKDKKEDSEKTREKLRLLSRGKGKSWTSATWVEGANRRRQAWTKKNRVAGWNKKKGEICFAGTRRVQTKRERKKIGKERGKGREIGQEGENKMRYV